MAKVIRKGTSYPLDRLLFLNHDKNPRPKSPMLFATHAIADRRSSHPYHIRTKRRMKDFDPTKLHWRVVAPVDLSKSSFVRASTARRYREAFRQELQRAGWDSDGQRRPEGGPHGMRTFDLGGALTLVLVKHASAVTATAEEVRESVSWAVKTLYGKHKDMSKPQQSPSTFKDISRRKPDEHSDAVKPQSSLP